MTATAAIIGAGLIGRSWAMVFARAGQVRLYDSVPEQLEAAREHIAKGLAEQQSYGLADDAAAARVAYVSDLDEALAGVDWVQENIAKGPMNDRAQRTGRCRRLLRALRADPSRARCQCTFTRRMGHCQRAAPDGSTRAGYRDRTRRAAADAATSQARSIRFRLRTTIMANRKVIITCAVTGSIHTPSMSPYLPVTPKEIAEAAIGAAEAGAAIVHLHARDPVDGSPTQDPKYFREFAPEIKRRSNVVLNFTTGGAATMTIEERLQPALQLEPEVASLNMGSMNFGLFPMLQRYKEFKHAWERSYLATSDDRIFRNTFKDIEYILTSCAANRTRFEIECYDIGHLYTAKHFLDRGVVKPPLFIQSVFGILGGIGAHPEDVVHMKRTADRLFGDQYRWSVLGAGRNQLPIAAQSAAMGGNVRVGLEDSLWLGPGTLAESNAAQVRAARQIIEGLGLTVATPDDAREILGLKGRADVGF